MHTYSTDTASISHTRTVHVRARARADKGDEKETRAKFGDSQGGYDGVGPGRQVVPVGRL